MAKSTSLNHTLRDEAARGPERAVLVGVLLDDREVLADPLAELDELAWSAGAEVVGRVTQRRRSYHAATCVGKGKLEEIKQVADASDANLVIFDNDLSPSQIREIEKAVERKVLDRSELILDIFATRARTHEARLQIELAQLEYTAPRLRGMWTHLERIAGAAGASGAGVVGGIGTRGPGESQIEIDRRLVQKRISQLRDKLAEIDRRRIREVQARQDHYLVSLVGYTNAGKSTLMNALTGATAHAEDRLFATLDTLTRRWPLGAGRHVLLSDTVGFIRDLPHHLVASFRATLEETLHADLLVHVVDASSPEAEQQIAAVNDVLGELGASEKQTLLVLNKVDAVEDEALLTVLRARWPDALVVSAVTGRGLDELAVVVDHHLQGAKQTRTLRIGAGNGKALSFLERFADIIDRDYVDGTLTLKLRIGERIFEHLRGLAPELRIVESGATTPT